MNIILAARIKVTKISQYKIRVNYFANFAMRNYEKIISIIKDNNFDRGGFHGSGVVGLKPFLDNKVPDEFKLLYTQQELKKLTQLRGTPRDIEERMKVKISDHYLKLVQRSEHLKNLIKARPEETEDLSGDLDPSNQNRYSPIPGLLHKYELVLLYTSGTCSSHCRYCYRLDLFTKKTGKQLAKINEVKDYIVNYNRKVKACQGTDPESGKPIYFIKEALLSGGDPMALSNKRLARFMFGLAEAGITTLRIGTKELAFFPARFDDNFFDMLDLFNKTYPHVRVVFVVHFTHPAEFLEMDDEQNYLPSNLNSFTFDWMKETLNPVLKLKKRAHFISLENQMPIIWKVNDDSATLNMMQKELYNKGIGNHYFFQCRNIQGKKEFALPLEETWKIFSLSQKGLSGIEKHARFVMSTEQGKIGVISVTDGKSFSVYIEIHMISDLKKI
ncbi:5391_t:CDS:1 [Gigaspora margarita]|uniref:5391_t:CDS:1 n=1 Tax=Gigaspora margarita TaxID=4874 RepID=A0ABN7VIU0_GIGMA|nr:5391_t:CDS:1 [Gigaspora margarita]